MRTVATVTFPEFELLDVYGPLELFGVNTDHFELTMLGHAKPSQISAQGPATVIDRTYAEGDEYDILLIPGGPGTRQSVDDKALNDWLSSAIPKAEIVAVVCTGTALVARTGLLDGHRATTNKAAFKWVTSQGPNVDWKPKARWVEDGKFFTSSGVSAGMDMTLAVIAHLLGKDQALETTKWVEYDWHQDPDWDPFAAIHGLV
jgi:putative intracellular protease/amidase